MINLCGVRPSFNHFVFTGYELENFYISVSFLLGLNFEAWESKYVNGLIKNTNIKSINDELPLGLRTRMRGQRLFTLPKDQGPLCFSQENKYQSFDLSKCHITNEYYKKFFVGLLEGDGSINVTLKNNNYFWVRFIIALKNEPGNCVMLEKLSTVVGGKVVIERQNKYVTWLAGTKSDVKNIIDILNKYPLLTLRKKCQLNFVENCLKYRDIKNFQKNRENMYSKYKELVLELNQKEPSLIDLPGYFYPWLSGFIEAEGNFSLVFNEKGHLRKSAFTIGQNDEYHILNKIKMYFKSNNKILMDKKKFNPKGLPSKFDYFRLHLYNKLSRELLFKHFDKNPLLGHKKVSYQKFFDYHNDR